MAEAGAQTTAREEAGMSGEVAYTVRAEWDAEAGRWVGTSPDIIGLVIEAAALEDVFAEAAEVLPILMTANSQPMPEGKP